MTTTLFESMLQELLKCTEMVYIVEEDSHKLVYLNQNILSDDIGDYMDKPCHSVFFGQDKPCAFCPADTVCLDAQQQGCACYSWDHFDSSHNRWLKIKNRIVEQDGIRYRVGNIVLIDDMMKLGSTAVYEMGSLMRLLEENTQIKQQLEKELSHDGMTGLFNRKRYSDDLAALEGTVDSLGVVYFDINNLKETNDLLGHADGDKLITCTAKCMLAAAGSNGKCYRIGGDEYVLLLPDCTADEPERCVNSFCTALERYNQTAQNPCYVAVGWSYDKHAIPRQLVAQAEVRMYQDKRQQGN